jgi:hypothetical protein
VGWSCLGVAAPRQRGCRAVADSGWTLHGHPRKAPDENEIVAPFDNAHGNPLCADVPGGAKSTGLALQLFHCHGYGSDGGPQRWHLLNGNGNAWPGVGPLYLIKNLDSRMCITLTSGASGARVVQEPCGQATFWVLHVQNANGTDPLFELIANGTSPCLAAGNLSDNNQTPLVAATCQGFGNAAEILELG